MSGRWEEMNQHDSANRIVLMADIVTRPHFIGERQEIDVPSQSSRTVHKIVRVTCERILILGGSGVELQHSAETLSTTHKVGGADLAGRIDEAIPESLMIPFKMIMGHEFPNRMSRAGLAEEDHSIQAGV